MSDAMRLQFAPMRLVDRPEVVTPEHVAERPEPERLSMATLLACYRDRLDARKCGVVRLGDLTALRQQAQLYLRDCNELWALIGELDRLEAACG